MTTQCPKCGSEDTGYTVGKLGGVPGATIHRCEHCSRAWTDWQQSEITALQAKLVDAAALHLADEQSIRNMQAEIDRLNGLLREIDDSVNLPIGVSVDTFTMTLIQEVAAIAARRKGK
jgi:hypothetical protein